MLQPICCERVEVELGDFLDGQVPRSLKLRIESHLAICPECWKEVQTLRHAMTVMSDLPRRPMPPRLKESIFRASGRDPTHARSPSDSGLLPLSQRS